MFAGGLERKILDTDKYEIWKADVIEGSSNKYDITEVVKSYTRLYPAAAATFIRSSALNESLLYLLLIAWAVIPSAAAASVRFNCSVANKLLIVGAIMFTPSFMLFFIISSKAQASN